MSRPTTPQTHRSHARAAAIAAALALAFAALLTGLPGGSGPAPAIAGCGKLNAEPRIVSNYAKPFADQYDKKLRVAVQRGRAAVTNWRVQLYTFGGFLLGESKYEKRMAKSDIAKMKLRVPLQPGRYTLVTKGTVHGCGEVERDQIVSFRDCLSKLPIKFVTKPGGTAADYRGWVSVKIAPKPVWAPLGDIRGTLTNFSGDIYGRAELPRGERKLIGSQTLDFKLKSGGLQPGGYTVNVTGKARQPRSCGDLSKSTVLQFG
jgi:hypothetical protein